MGNHSSVTATGFESAWPDVLINWTVFHCATQRVEVWHSLSVPIRFVLFGVPCGWPVVSHVRPLGRGQFSIDVGCPGLEK